MAKVRVRFAPSPTGYLHVGGARTAIFNWLFARGRGGEFILRIEDTDRARSSEDMVRAILDGMAWLGMKPDEGPFFQSANIGDHVLAAERLISTGKAYRCFCDPESLKARRLEMEKAGKDSSYPGTCRSLTPEESDARASGGEKHAVRFEVPPGTISWNDMVHGPTAFESDILEDFVIIRSDGSPTYMLSVVCDDAASGITHVIRGDDHLSNTPKQILIYEALGHEPPAFAHIPLILGEDKKRLSKRHGAMSIMEYRDMGYLSDAMFNFLSLLGWSPGDDRQKMSLPELIETFDFRGVGKAGAVFDLTKLEWLNGQYIDDLPVEALLPHLRADLERSELWEAEYDGEGRERVLKILELVQPRARTLHDLAEIAEPFFHRSDEFDYDPKGVKKHLKGEDLTDRLTKLHAKLSALQEWSPEHLENAVRELADELEISAGKLIHPARLAVTGRTASPGLFEVLELIGRDRSLARLNNLIGFIERRTPDDGAP